jgi:hypothetical protein
MMFERGADALSATALDGEEYRPEPVLRHPSR